MFVMLRIRDPVLFRPLDTGFRIDFSDPRSETRPQDRRDRVADCPKGGSAFLYTNCFVEKESNVSVLNRIRIGSGFNRVSGPGSRRAKMTH
jgi:hypothetical protein